MYVSLIKKERVTPIVISGLRKRQESQGIKGKERKLGVMLTGEKSGLRGAEETQGQTGLSLSLSVRSRTCEKNLE